MQNSGHAYWLGIGAFDVTSLFKTDGGQSGHREERFSHQLVIDLQFDAIAPNRPTFARGTREIELSPGARPIDDDGGVGQADRRVGLLIEPDRPDRGAEGTAVGRVPQMTTSSSGAKVLEGCQGFSASTPCAVVRSKSRMTGGGWFAEMPGSHAAATSSDRIEEGVAARSCRSLDARVAPHVACSHPVGTRESD